jgi:hypothetical protein
VAARLPLFWDLNGVSGDAEGTEEIEEIEEKRSVGLELRV